VNLSLADMEKCLPPPDVETGEFSAEEFDMLLNARWVAQL
jgi:hypothetical protein